MYYSILNNDAKILIFIELQKSIPQKCNFHIFAEWVFKEDFSQPKIIYPNMTKYMPFVYDENAYYTNQKCFIVTGQSMAYLTAFFNSSLFKFCFRESFPELQGGTREMSKIFFDKIPVLQVANEINAKFKSSVYDIQSEYNKSKAIAIDAMIFDLYHLSEKERQVIGFVEIE